MTLASRLDELDAVAKAACDDDSRNWLPDYCEVFAAPHHGFIADAEYMELATHIARFDPATVLLMTAALRAASERDDAYPATVMDADWFRRVENTRKRKLEAALDALDTHLKEKR